MENTNPLKAYVGLAAIIGGSSLGVVTFFAIFAPQQISFAAWIVAPLCLMGVALGYLAGQRPSGAQERE